MNADMKELVFVNSLNAGVLAVSFTDLESILKIGLMAATLVYTLVKTVKALDGKDKDGSEDK